MRAVNLMPGEARRTGIRSAPVALGPAHLLVAALGVAIVIAVLSVLSANTVNDRRAQLASLRAQLAQTTAEAGRLSTYTRYEQLAQQRIETVRAIAASRFDWQSALRSVARAVPPGTAFQSLQATVAPGSGAGGSGSSLRQDVDAPAFEIQGCTTSQDQVARLISSLRRIGGVTRVSLDSSQKGDGPSAGANASTGGAGGCAAGSPTFSLVVFFSPVPSAGPNGVTSLTTVSAGPAAPGSAR